MIPLSFICYDKDRAIKPRPTSDSNMIWEVFNAHTLFMEDETRIILDTYTGIRVPLGYVAKVVPNPAIFWYADLSTQGGVYFIEPGDYESIKLFCLPIMDIDGRIPAEGDPIALVIIQKAYPFTADWDGNEPDRVEKYKNLN